MVNSFAIQSHSSLSVSDSSAVSCCKAFAGYSTQDMDTPLCKHIFPFLPYQLQLSYPPQRFCIHACVRTFFCTENRQRSQRTSSLILPSSRRILCHFDWQELLRNWLYQRCVLLWRKKLTHQCLDLDTSCIVGHTDRIWHTAFTRLSAYLIFHAASAAHSRAVPI